MSVLSPFCRWETKALESAVPSWRHTLAGRKAGTGQSRLVWLQSPCCFQNTVRPLKRGSLPRDSLPLGTAQPGPSLYLPPPGTQPHSFLLWQVCLFKNSSIDGKKLSSSSAHSFKCTYWPIFTNLIVHKISPCAVSIWPQCLALCMLPCQCSLQAVTQLSSGVTQSGASWARQMARLLTRCVTWASVSSRANGCSHSNLLQGWVNEVKQCRESPGHTYSCDR